MALDSRFAGLALSVDTPARMTIIHPVTRQDLRIVGEDGKTTDEVAWIDLLAMSSTVGQAHDRTINDRLIKARGARYTSEQVEADLVEKYARLTKDWNLAALNGQPLDIDCTTSNARDLYSMTELSWLREQVAQFVSDMGNFRPADAKLSSTTPNTSSP